ncbi:MAG: tetratricopeptide repeat protein [Thermoplasmatota archaeon]
MDGSSILEGYTALAAKDLKKAHGTFRGILDETKDKKTRYDALIGLAITYRELGESKEAIDTLKKAVESYPTPKEALYDLGNLYEEMEQHALAIQNFDLAIAMDPNFTDAYINRGVAWFNMTKYDQGLRDFRNALENDPRSSRALSNAGITYLEEKKYEKAIDFFDRSLEEDPENIHSLCGKGLALFYMDQYDESIICFDAAISINPDFYLANYYKGHILKKLDLIEEAEEAILEALDSREEYALAWFELGEIYRSKGDDQRALGAYDKAIKYQGDSFEEALYQKGRMLNKKGDHRGAVACYKRICKKNPYIPDVWLQMGISLAKLEGQQNRSMAALKNAFLLDQSDPEIVYNLAVGHIRNGDKERALKALTDGMERFQDPKNGVLLARLLYETGSYNEAIITSEEVTSKDQNHPEAWLIMGRAYGSLGKSEEYKQCLRKYLHIRPDDTKVKREMERIS